MLASHSFHGVFLRDPGTAPRNHSRTNCPSVTASDSRGRIAAPVQPRIVVHAHFDHTAFRQLQFAHQLDADGPGGGAELDLLQQAPPDQPEIAVHVAQANTE